MFIGKYNHIVIIIKHSRCNDDGVAFSDNLSDTKLIGIAYRYNHDFDNNHS